MQSHEPSHQRMQCNGNLQCEHDRTREQVAAEQASIRPCKERVRVGDCFTRFRVPQMTNHRSGLERIATT